MDQGLVMLSDTRTNAGMDNIARFRKSFTYHVEGERAITLLCSGNLSITQGVKTMLSRAIREAESDPPRGAAGGRRDAHHAGPLS